MATFKPGNLLFSTPTMSIIVGVTLSIPAILLGWLLIEMGPVPAHGAALDVNIRRFIWIVFLAAAIPSFVLLVSGIAIAIWAPESWKIRHQVRRRLFASRYGNPLSLSDGQVLPVVRVRKDTKNADAFWLSIHTASIVADDLERVQAAISSALVKRFSGFAVVEVNSDVAHRMTEFKIENVTIDRSITVNSLDDMASDRYPGLIIQNGTFIDLTTSGSMVAAGKTRSGKTTGIIALLLQVLNWGPDAYDSSVVIIDPKVAELSRVPHTVTLDENGTALPVLAAMHDFEASIKRRQAVLNDRSERTGLVHKWFDPQVDMKPSFLFIDEFVALRSMIPSRADKDNPGYTLAEFDGLLRRIITMGASAGCFVIISIAQASADQIPTMLRDAFSTRILFRPTADEGALLWDRQRIQALPSRTYGPGDAWFSSTDGVHDSVTYVHFPSFAPEFGEYGELARRLTEYNAEQEPHPATDD